ncbi:ParB N-terminal domain-containing protein [Actinoplanes sp. NPDC000266]
MTVILALRRDPSAACLTLDWETTMISEQTSATTNGDTSVILSGPANAVDVQNVVELRLDALDKSGLLETLSIEYRDRPLPLPVIQMPINLLTYNPNTHRIRAQRALDPERDRALEVDPYGQTAQKYLHDLLMGSPTDPGKTDPSFDALKEDLREHGQNDPGIITRSGVLINGNTRRAALKELGSENIRVAVLPKDAGLDDIQGIELALQLRKDHRRDYSFMNLLLAIDERVASGHPPVKIQRAFRMKAATFERNVWILQFVREAIERSRSAGTAGAELSMRLIDFEADQGQLEELYRAWNVLKANSPDQAEALKEQRLAAMVLDKSKTDLRLIDADFTQKYLKRIVPDIVATAAPRAIPGTSITTSPPSAELEKLKSWTTSILKAKATELYPALVTPEKLAEASKELKNIDEAFNSALDKAGKNSRVTKRRYAAVERLTDASESLDLAASAVAEARATANFDADDLDDALSQLQVSITKLAQLVLRSAEKAQDRPGLAWLRGATTLKDDAS